MTRSQMLILFFLSFILTVGCATTIVSTTGLVLISETEYRKILEQQTLRDQRYQGLYNVFDLSATLVDSRLSQAQLEQSARLYQWDRAQFQAEKNKVDQTLKDQTEIFLSFYTPEKKNDDLNKSGTQWRVYLESGGRRWEGKVKKIKTTLSEVQGIYPHHTRFATPYSITFPVATAEVTAQDVQFLLAGPAGTTKLEFKMNVAK